MPLPFLATTLKTRATTTDLYFTCRSETSSHAKTNRQSQLLHPRSLELPDPQHHGPDVRQRHAELQGLCRQGRPKQALRYQMAKLKRVLVLTGRTLLLMRTKATTVALLLHRKQQLTHPGRCILCRKPQTFHKQRRVKTFQPRRLATTCSRSLS